MMWELRSGILVSTGHEGDIEPTFAKHELRVALFPFGDVQANIRRLS